METRRFTPRELLSRTMPFVWAKLFLRLLATGISVGIFALGIWMSGRFPAAGLVLVIIALVSASAIYFILVRIVGFGVRVGHIAVLTETIKTGQLPANQIAYGKQRVVERIGTAATFFVINKLVDRAVQQLQRGLASAASMLGAIPGMAKLVAFANTVLKVALKYVDECCIAWIFYGPPSQSAWKGALDGVTIYAQNWKRVLGGAVKTALMVILLTFGLFVIIALIFSAIIGSAFDGGIWTLLALVIGFLVALAIKQAFIDSWVMIRMLVTFLEVAPTTELRVDIYNRLSNMSPAFRTMTTRAQAEIGNAPLGAAAPVSATASRPATPRPAAGAQVFCGQCGTRNPAGTAFCGECGQRV